MPENKLTLAIYLEHHDCPKGDEWRRMGGEGFPRFAPFLHERYNYNRTYMRCEACETTIAHSLVNSTETESN